MENYRNMESEGRRENKDRKFYEANGRVNEQNGGWEGHGGRGKRGDERGREGKGESGGREGRGDYGEHGGRGGHGGAGGPRGGQMFKGRLGGDETAILVFVGSLNCIRHKPYMRIGEMMQEGKAALLCPSMSDFSSGRYLNQIVDAIVELSKERGTKHFVLTYGCQWVILSTDGELLVQQLKNEYDIDLKLWEDSHLEFGDHE